MLASAGRDAEALEHLRRAVQIDANDGEAHYDLAVQLLDGHRLEEAVSEFRLAVQRMPESCEARNNLGIALGTLGRLDEAIDQFERALKLPVQCDGVMRNLTFARQARQRAGTTR